MNKIPVYMMPGMAASPKIFDRIKLPDKYEIHYLQWMIPLQNESLQDYTKRLINKQITHHNPVLLGVSFGGIVVQEMTRFMQPRKLIIISSVKTHREFPPLFEKMLQYHLYRLFPSRILKHITILEKMAFTKNLKLKMKLYKNYMTVNDPVYLNWSIKQILEWKQNQFPENYVHIVGEYDKVFPVKYIMEPKIIIPKGRHDMIIFKAHHINRVLKEVL